MGNISLVGATSGGTTLVPQATGTYTVTLPASSDTLATVSNPTFTGTVTATTVTSPSATALTIQSAGTTAMTVDTSQNVGIGTTSPAYNLHVSSATTPVFMLQSTASATNASAYSLLKANSGAAGNYYRAIIGYDSSNTTDWAIGNYGSAKQNIGFYIGPTFSGPAALIDSSGNVGIGTSSPAGKLDILTGTNRGFFDDSGGSLFRLNAVNAANSVYAPLSLNGSVLTFEINATERARIDSSGNLLVGTTGNVNLEKFNVTGSPANLISRFYNSNASNPNGVGVFYSALSPNGPGNAFFYAADSTALRFNVQSNGGIANYSANNTNLSDERLKKDVQLAGLYLDKICAIPVKTFLYNDQTDNDLNLGVIAQDVNAVAPELVCRDGWKDKDGEPTDYLTIYQTDLQYALMKCIQELSAKNDALEARLAALEAK